MGGLFPEKNYDSGFPIPQWILHIRTWSGSIWHPDVPACCECDRHACWNQNGKSCSHRLTIHSGCPDCRGDRQPGAFPDLVCNCQDSVVTWLKAGQGRTVHHFGHGIPRQRPRHRARPKSLQKKGLLHPADGSACNGQPWMWCQSGSSRKVFRFTWTGWPMKQTGSSS
jgi:hypothetical protein